MNSLKFNIQKASSDKLYKLLRNKIYIVMIEHKRDELVYQGQHEAIVPKELFDKVQEKLDNSNYRNTHTCQPSTNLLSGKFFNTDGKPFINQKTSKN